MGREEDKRLRQAGKLPDATRSYLDRKKQTRGVQEVSAPPPPAATPMTSFIPANYPLAAPQRKFTTGAAVAIGVLLMFIVALLSGLDRPKNSPASGAPPIQERSKAAIPATPAAAAKPTVVNDAPDELETAQGTVTIGEEADDVFRVLGTYEVGEPIITDDPHISGAMAVVHRYRIRGATYAMLFRRSGSDGPYTLQAMKNEL